MTVLAVLVALESTFPSFCLSYKIQHNEATMAVLTVLAVWAVMTATPLNSTPLFCDSWPKEEKRFRPLRTSGSKAFGSELAGSGPVLKTQI